MYDEGREKSIKSIIKLEERVGRCGRCQSLLKCTARPSVGRGDLQPEVMMVFETASDFTRDTEWIIGLRNSVKELFQVEEVYHTFLVRCQPKACPHSQGDNYCLTSKLLDRNNICLLTGQGCDGLSVKPPNEAMINCLTYLLEEIAVLNPPRILLMGKRVTEYVLKAYGLHQAMLAEPKYKIGDNLFLPASSEQEIDVQELKCLAAAIR